MYRKNRKRSAPADNKQIREVFYLYAFSFILIFLQIRIFNTIFGCK